MVASQFVLEIHGGNPDWPLLLAAGARIHACPSEKNALQCCLMLLICTLVCHTYSCVSSQQSYKADWRDIIIPIFTEETNPEVTWLKPRGFSNQNLPSGLPPWEPSRKASYELNICVKPLCREWCSNYFLQITEIPISGQELQPGFPGRSTTRKGKSY